MKRNRTRFGFLAAVTGAVFLPVSALALTLTGNVRFMGNLAITGSISKGSGTFSIDHPLDPKNKILYHSFVESPEVKNIYNGLATLDANGNAVIQLPSYFDALNGEVRYQFFPIDQAMPDLYIKRKESNNSFEIGGGVPGGEVSWQVTGNRHDPYVKANPVINEVVKDADTFVKKGECVYEPLCE